MNMDIKTYRLWSILNYPNKSQSCIYPLILLNFFEYKGVVLFYILSRSYDKLQERILWNSKRGITPRKV